MTACAMPDWAFYSGPYGGTELEEADFPRYAREAAGVLAGFQRSWQMKPVGPDADKNAVCHLAEALHYFDWAESGGAASMSLGSVSVGARTARLPGPRDKQKELYRVAGVYFDIYRGPAGGGAL